MFNGSKKTKTPNIAEDIKIELKILIEVEVIVEVYLVFVRKVVIISVEPCVTK